MGAAPTRSSGAAAQSQQHIQSTQLPKQQGPRCPSTPLTQLRPDQEIPLVYIQRNVQRNCPPQHKRRLLHQRTVICWLRNSQHAFQKQHIHTPNTHQVRPVLVYRTLLYKATSHAHGKSCSYLHGNSTSTERAPCAPSTQPFSYPFNLSPCKQASQPAHTASPRTSLRMRCCARSTRCYCAHGCCMVAGRARTTAERLVLRQQKAQHHQQGAVLLWLKPTHTILCAHSVRPKG